MSEVRVNLRMSKELLDRIKAAEENVSEGIRDTLARAYPARMAKEITTDIDTVVSGERFSRGDFRFPVGDVICAETNPQTQLWWCPPERMTVLIDRVKEWRDKGGFSFHVGKPGGGTWYSPEVIEEIAQERRKNGQFSPSCKMMNALKGDKLVWLEIKDTDKALRFMESHTDIPCAVRCDVHKYSVDTEYQAAFDLANGLFIYYWMNDRPRKCMSETLKESDIAEMLDL